MLNIESSIQNSRSTILLQYSFVYLLNRFHERKDKNYALIKYFNTIILIFFEKLPSSTWYYGNY